MNAVGHNDGALTRNQGCRDELITRGLADTQDSPRRSHARQQAPAERTCEKRASDGPVERAVERVQIVARDERPLRRKMQDQMRVAMVRDVEEIEGSAAGAQPVRVVPEAVENPISEVRRRGCTNEGQPR